MISYDNPIAMIDVDVRFERQMAKCKASSIFTNLYIHHCFVKLRFPNQGLVMMMIVENSGFDRLCKTEKSFCLQLEASLKG